MKPSSCINAGNYKSIDRPLDPRVKWKSTIPHDISLESFLKLKCNQQHAVGLKQATPLIDGTKECIIYASCPANLFCAMKRQGLITPRVDPVVLSDFNKFCDHIFDTEIAPLLENFDYSYEVWYNHLTYNQQNEIDRVEKQDIDDSQKVYNLFCKRESQMVEGEATQNTYGETTSDAMPKNRCISAPNAEYKYVHGPVVYALEKIFKHSFKGYTSGLSFTDKEQLYNARRARGLINRVDGDGSAYDTTQDTLLKFERRIYKWLADTDKITHVSKQAWDIFTSDEVKMKVTYQSQDDIYSRQIFGILKVLGRVMSGNMDTTFGNTLRMAMYNRYVWEWCMKVPKDSYDLDCQGDDFDVFHDGNISNETIASYYYKVWQKGEFKDGKFLLPIHGLGQILKFISFGTISDTSFCSTECFYCPQCKSYKIVRQLERFITLNQWSKTLLSLSNHDQAYFLTCLYEANKLWIGELDIFKQANEWLNYGVTKPSATITGKAKKILQYDKRFEHLVEKQSPLLSKLCAIDPTLKYSLQDRVSSKLDCCNKAWRETVLTRRYDMPASTITSTIDTIIKTDKYANNCMLPDLIAGFKTRTSYKIDLCDDTNM